MYTLTIMPDSFSRPATLTAEVHRTLRNRILSAEIPPGSRLRENEVATDLAVSRTPVREAVRLLIQEGLLEAVPNRGVHVKSLSLEEALDAYELRQDLEGRAARLAAQRASDEDVRGLERRLHRIGEVSDRTYAEQIEADMAFHQQIARVGRNVPLIGVLEALNVQVANLKIHTRDRNSSPTTRRQHLALFEAIAGRDAHAAETAAREHIASFSELLRERLREPAPGVDL